MIDRIVLVTKKTEYTDLVERFGTADQARFVIRSAGGDFGSFEKAHAAYAKARDAICAAIPEGIRFAEIERAFVPTYLFAPDSLVLTLGPDGLVINVAKYLAGQAILAFSPEPGKVGGILSRHRPAGAAELIQRALHGKMTSLGMTMAQAQLNDGQKLIAANDLFIGPRSHGSARYRIHLGDRSEEQSSSGIIVSTGVGSSGWYSSIVTGAIGVANGFFGGENSSFDPQSARFAWDADELRFSVREPWPSPSTFASLVYGSIGPFGPLVIESLMPRDGVIFSDGIEADYVAFNAGTTATIGLYERKATLLC
jgi:NAD kinase